MGSCIICGTPVDGRVCDSHQEDVVFEFRGNDPNQLVENRFYRGTVDGYAEFGVFVDVSPNVTGLLHRSELDRRLESLEWEPGDDVFVQVKNVRDNGDVDLAWSIRQSDREFRGALVQEGTEEKDAEQKADDDGPVRHTPTQAQSPGRRRDEGDEAEADASADRGGTDADESGDADAGGNEASTNGAGGGQAGVETDPREAESEPEADRDRVEVGSLGDRVGETVRIEGEVVSARQTGGPTVFELRDETGVVDCAAFIEAGVRAYPEVDVGDTVRLDGEVEVRRNEIQVETDALAVLTDEEAEAVQQRLANALTAEARPESVRTPADHESLDAVSEDVLDAAETVRRAVLESRPIVVRHAATADGYVAGAAVERAVLPLIRDEHAKSDAEYHYFTRRPLEGMVYDMDDATNDVTRMLQNRDRHGEKLPLVLLLGVGSTVESEDGLGLLGVYGADRVVVDAAAADPEVDELVSTLVNPDAAGSAEALSTGALAATLAATVNADVADDITHLPAVSYWEGAPEAYVDAAADAGFDADRVAELREAVALEAFYQSYEDKRELVTDILFGEDDGALAGHISEQFREKLETELDTAAANLETRESDGVEFAVLDADAYAHRYDFPPTALLADELHRRERGDGVRATLVVGTDDLYLRTTDGVDVRGVADDAAEAVPDAGVTTRGVREGRVEFLSGRRGAVVDAVVEAAADRLA